MDAQAFWAVIGTYNQETLWLQAVLLLFLVTGLALSYTGKVVWLAKLALGLTNLMIGLVFFGTYGTEPIQTFFALPLYLCCGVLFLYESVHNRADVPERPGPLQWALLVLYVLYPAISLALGNRFPQMVTHIMPCPVISLSITVYASYQKQNKLLLLLLTVWGLTGIKSLLFSAYEDLILLSCGIYGIFLTIRACRRG